MKFWVKSSELAGVPADEMVAMSYVEKSTDGNAILGSVVQHSGDQVRWSVNDDSGKTVSGFVDSIDEAKAMTVSKFLGSK